MIGRCGIEPGQSICKTCPVTCKHRAMANKYHVAPVENRTYNGKVFRSKLESDYAQYLDSLKIPWQYESAKLVYTSGRGKHYTKLIDFEVTMPEGVEYHECKGYANPDEMRRLKALAKSIYGNKVHIVEKDLQPIPIKDYVQAKGNKK